MSAKFIVQASILIIGAALFCGCAENEASPPAKSGYGYFQQGEELMGNKQYDSAVESFTRALQEDPDIPVIYNERGVALYDLKKYEAAADDFRTAVKLFPDFLAANQFLGMTLCTLGKYDEAIPPLQHAAELDPLWSKATTGGKPYATDPKYGYTYGWPEGYFGLGQTYEQLGAALSMTGRFADAVTACSRAIELDPSRGMPFYYRGISYASLEIRNFREARSDLERAGQLGVTVDDTVLWLVANSVPDPWNVVLGAELTVNGPGAAQRLRDQLQKNALANLRPVAPRTPTTGAADDAMSHLQVVQETEAGDSFVKNFYDHVRNSDASRRIGCVIIELPEEKKAREKMESGIIGAPLSEATRLPGGSKATEEFVFVRDLLPGEKRRVATGLYFGKGNKDRIAYAIVYAWYE